MKVLVNQCWGMIFQDQKQCYGKCFLTTKKEQCYLFLWKRLVNFFNNQQNVFNNEQYNTF